MVVAAVVVAFVCDRKRYRLIEREKEIKKERERRGAYL